MFSRVQHRRQKSDPAKKKKHGKNQQGEHGFAANRLLSNHPSRGVNNKRCVLKIFFVGAFVSHQTSSPTGEHRARGTPDTD